MERSTSEMKSESFAKSSPRENKVTIISSTRQQCVGRQGAQLHQLVDLHRRLPSQLPLSMNVAGTITIQIDATRNLNLNPPKKWTETPWLEGPQSTVRPRVTSAGLFASEWKTLWTWGLRYQATGSRQDSRAEALAAARHPNTYVRTTCELSIRLFNACCGSGAPPDGSGFLGCAEPAMAAKTGSSGSFEAGWRLQKIAQWHPICSKSILLPIDARTGLRTLRAGVSPACKRGMATIGQWCHGQRVGQPSDVKF